MRGLARLPVIAALLALPSRGLAARLDAALEYHARVGSHARAEDLLAALTQEQP